MTGKPQNAGVAALATDLHAPLTAHEAAVEADRCYFCHDAPCVTACPTDIDIPLFIRQIQTGNPAGSAATIFAQNILGGMCARVCPTETLCEQVCVRNEAEEQPVRIGQLQRYATDYQMATGEQPFQRAASTGKKVCVVGSGPAGLACAHRLALYGHSVTIIDRAAKGGGLNEYGIAAYKTVDNFASRELNYILSIGGIELQTGVALGTDKTLAQLKDEYDAVFIGIGLASVNEARLPGSELAGVRDAVEFIAQLRQTKDYSSLQPGRRVVVIGGGMTAVDAAVQARMLGAEDVTIAYRRGVERMNASQYEQELAQTRGVSIKCNLQPVAIAGDGAVNSIELEYTNDSGDGLVGTGETVVLPADTVFMAIGQAFDDGPLQGTALNLSQGRIEVNDERRSSDPAIWAGGDCIAGGEDLTVAAVQDGKLAAESIHRSLTA